jgi:hypothetical protein
MRALGICLGLLLTAASASAEGLALGSRVISRAESADPDAPVTAYGYGPRGRASLGLDVSLAAFRRKNRQFRLGMLGFVAFEDANRRRVFPGEVGRSWVALSGSWAMREPLPALFGAGHELELGLELGRRSAFSLDGFVVQDPWQQTDVPFGAGGVYLGVDTALRLVVLPRLTLTSRVTLRSYMNAYPELFGQHEAGAHVASALEEGAQGSAALEVGARLALASWAEPALRLYADVIEPHDDNAKTLWLVRGLLGLAVPGEHFELEPFVDAEAGHGQGLLVNRNQLRLGVGVRLYAR